MANFFFHYSSLCILSFFVGSSISSPPNQYVMKLENKDKILYAAKGYIVGGIWNVTDDGTVISNGRESSSVVVTLCETFGIGNETISYDNVGIYNGTLMSFVNVEDWKVSISLSERAETLLTTEKLKSAMGKASWNITFPVDRMTPTSDRNRCLSCRICPGLSGNPFPDTMLQLEGSIPLVKVFGYKIFSDIRFLGEDADTITENMKNGNKSWKEFTLNITWATSEKKRIPIGNKFVEGKMLLLEETRKSDIIDVFTKINE